MKADRRRDINHSKGGKSQLQPRLSLWSIYYGILKQE